MIEYEHEAQVYEAQSNEEAIGMCPYLGNLAVEEADILLEMAAKGQEIIAESEARAGTERAASYKVAAQVTAEDAIEKPSQKLNEEELFAILTEDRGPFIINPTAEDNSGAVEFYAQEQIRRLQLSEDLSAGTESEEDIGSVIKEEKPAITKPAASPVSEWKAKKYEPVVIKTEKVQESAEDTEVVEVKNVPDASLPEESTKDVQDEIQPLPAEPLLEENSEEVEVPAYEAEIIEVPPPEKQAEESVPQQPEPILKEAYIIDPIDEKSTEAYDDVEPHSEVEDDKFGVELEYVYKNIEDELEYGEINLTDKNEEDVIAADIYETQLLLESEPEPYPEEHPVQEEVIVNTPPEEPEKKDQPVEIIFQEMHQAVDELEPEKIPEVEVLVEEVASILADSEDALEYSVEGSGEDAAASLDKDLSVEKLSEVFTEMFSIIGVECDEEQTTKIANLVIERKIAIKELIENHPKDRGTHEVLKTLAGIFTDLRDMLHSLHSFLGRTVLGVGSRQLVY